MRELDTIEIIVEKDKYAKDGVHKGMQGWICDDECRNGRWLVNFPQYGENQDISTIGIHETDMRLIAKMDAKVNEVIRKQFGE